MKINYIDYKNYLNNSDITNSIVLFILNIKKDIRNISTNVFLFLRRNKIFDSEIIENDKENTIKNYQDIKNNIDFYIKIIPDNYPREDEDLILSIEFSIFNMNLKDFDIKWTVKHFQSNNQYLNTRFEEKLKVKYSDFFLGDNIIHVLFTNKDNKDLNFEKNYIYIKFDGPFGGNCNVDPNKGTSLETNFNFIFENWKSNSDHLLYNLVYLDREINLKIEITKSSLDNFIDLNNFLFPGSDNIYVQIKDIEGRKSLHRCPIIVKTNKNLAYLKDNFSKFLINNEDNDSLLLNIIYLYNLQSIKNLNIRNQMDFINKFENEIIQNFANLIINLFNFKENKLNDNIDFDNYIYSIIKITKYRIKENIISDMLNIITKMVINEEKDLEKIYFICNNIHNLLREYSSQELNKEDKKFILDLFDINENLLKRLNKNLENVILPGESIINYNKEYDTKVSKISNRNIMDITMENDYDNNLKKSKILRYNQQNENENNCEEKAFCLEKNKIKNFINSSNQNITEIGFNSKLNKNKFLNVELNDTRSVFSETSCIMYFKLKLKLKLSLIKNMSEKSACISDMTSYITNSINQRKIK